MLSDQIINTLQHLHKFTSEYDTMKMLNTRRSNLPGDFDNYDTTTTPALNDNIAYNARKKRAVSTSGNQVSTKISESSLGPTYLMEYEDIPSTLNSRVSRSTQSSIRAFNDSISMAAIKTNENTAYNAHGIVK